MIVTFFHEFPFIRPVKKYAWYPHICMGSYSDKLKYEPTIFDIVLRNHLTFHLNREIRTGGSLQYFRQWHSTILRGCIGSRGQIRTLLICNHWVMMPLKVHQKLNNRDKETSRFNHLYCLRTTQVNATESPTKYGVQSLSRNYSMLFYYILCDVANWTIYEVHPNGKCDDFLLQCIWDSHKITSYLLGRPRSGANVFSTDWSSTASNLP